MAEAKRLLSLADVAARTGASLDTLRRRASELAAAGLIHRVGHSWVAESCHAEAIAKAARSGPPSGQKSAS
jgi:hypothetical protein